MTDPSIRQMHGCDGDEGRIAWERPCEKCQNGCEYCNSGWVEEKVCVNSILSKSTHTLSLFLDSLSIFKSHNILPESGGWLDQDQKFRDVYNCYNQFANKIQNRLEERSNMIKGMKNGK